jgi:hypothetical protein
MDSYCDKAQYIDNEYICWYTGEVCKYYVPNMYECSIYNKQSKKKQNDTKFNV